MMHRQGSESQPPPGPTRVGPLQVGPIQLERNLVLAPMAGVTNLPFRLIAKEAGAALVFTETVSAKGLVAGGAKSWRLVDHSPREEPLAFQLFGGDAHNLGEATRMLTDRGARFVDLNLGCPVKKFLKHGAGACLLRNPPGIAPLVRAIRKANPGGVVSVKLRTGWDENSITAPEVARIAEAEGVDLITIHGRTRAQLYSGIANRSRIRDVVEAVSVPVLANGDITRAEHAISMLKECGAAGVMIGRGALQNPWLFSQINELAGGRPVPRPTARQREALVERHLDLMTDYFSDDRSAVHMLKKYLCAYSAGLHGANEFRERVTRATELQSVLDDARTFFRSAA